MPHGVGDMAATTTQHGVSDTVIAQYCDHDDEDGEDGRHGVNTAVAATVDVTSWHLCDMSHWHIVG